MPTVYSPLPDDHIRLLIVQPGAFQDDISTSLVPHYLGDESDAKRHAGPHEAVSYVWGSPELTKSIRCDEHEIQVTENVDVLLRHLRLPDAPRRLWVDAICINQTDLAERSQQVLMMGKLFSAAMRVLIWVGPDDEETAVVVELFTKWQARAPRDIGNKPWILPLKENRDDDLISGRALYNGKEASIIKRFASRPWFRRLWTFQEACLASDAEVVCGSFRVPWIYVLTVARKLQSLALLQDFFGPAGDSMAALTRFSITAIVGEKRNKPNLLDLLMLVRNREATDDRDKVFGILGMFCTEDCLGVSPDYTIDANEVYLRCARNIIIHQNSLTLFSYCFGPLQDAGLPSWVPDWRLPRQTAVFKLSLGQGTKQHKTHDFSKSSGFTGAPKLLGTNERVLRLRGACLGTVSSMLHALALLRRLPVQSIRTPYSAYFMVWHAGRELHKLLSSMSLAESYSPTGESSRVALLRTIAADRLPAAQDMRKFVRYVCQKAYEGLFEMLSTVCELLRQQPHNEEHLHFANGCLEQLEKNNELEDYESVLKFCFKYLASAAQDEWRKRSGILGIWGRWHRVATRKGKTFNPSEEEFRAPATWMATLLSVYAGHVGEPQQEDEWDATCDGDGTVSSRKEKVVRDFVAVCDIIWTLPTFSESYDEVPGVGFLTQQLLGSSCKIRRGSDWDLGWFPTMDAMSASMRTFSSGRVVFQTNNGLLGLCPDYMTEGDEVWDLVGADVPSILRPQPSNSQDKGETRRYKLMGECYVHGVTNGRHWGDIIDLYSSSPRGEDLKLETIDIV